MSSTVDMLISRPNGKPTADTSQRGMITPMEKTFRNFCSSGFGSRFIAVDANGKKRSLSFRDLSRFCITDETAIQAELSPAESGQYPTVTAERSVFKLSIWKNTR